MRPLILRQAGAIVARVEPVARGWRAILYGPCLGMVSDFPSQAKAMAWAQKETS